MFSKPTTMDDVIQFFKKRPYLRSPSLKQVITEVEYEILKEGGSMGDVRDIYLKGYADGWSVANKGRCRFRKRHIPQR
jgi:hypothetical protein